ncbi:hypothetical protein A3D71_04110 [Candidatus Kaiserbacteria bacterium RIFCSPHIGHO2_02_FULL_55_20]|uniref:Uncharacterized protein n=1 Tax=Candidatus Kaiserbacteria bacterium RIFCSPHIGHO2_02_FULL_55_20 TaxID=1798497 RepID=A0A1F6DWY7_9BACT|nr:MAG: hypothetical protein A3D71_04110 [Candidatus Kaiserbacteria bacterium RIFCSPHIGHO2_02_FULL_55_20]
MLPRQKFFVYSHFLTLLLVGFLIGTSLTFLYKKAIPGGALRGLSLSDPTVALAPVCPAPANVTRDIYFVSCGGIY